MKRKFLNSILAAQLAGIVILSSAAVYADDPAADPTQTKIKVKNTDYFVVVDTLDDSGIDFYASVVSAKPIPGHDPIPENTVLYIGEEYSDGKDVWGHVIYNDEKGFVLLDDCTLVGRTAAINAELENGSAQDVSYSAVVSAPNGSASLYYGPGEKYGIMPGAEKIPNGTSLYIYLEATLPDGSQWAQTNFGEKEAWIPMNQLSHTSTGLNPTAAEPAQGEASGAVVTEAASEEASAADAASAPEAAADQVDMISATEGEQSEEASETTDDASQTPEENAEAAEQTGDAVDAEVVEEVGTPEEQEAVEEAATSEEQKAADEAGDTAEEETVEEAGDAAEGQAEETEEAKEEATDKESSDKGPSVASVVGVGGGASAIAILVALLRRR